MSNQRFNLKGSLARIATLSSLLFATLTFADMNVSSLTWMTGTWEGNLGGSTIEEVWTRPKQGTIQASVRIASPEGVSVHEVVIIRETGSGTKLFLQQWSGEFESVEAPAVMDLSNQTENSITFVGSEDLRFEKLTYHRASEDTFEILLTMKNQPEFKITLNRKD